MNLKFTKITTHAITPTRGSEYSAGYDLYAATEEPIKIHPGTTKIIWTDIAMAIPKGMFGAIYARSGVATKRGLRPANCVGILDSDYRGNIGVALHNDSNQEQIVAPHERIAQLVIQPFCSLPLKKVDELDETERGDGGFGSTGAI